jgi:hypothetical protein
MKSTMKKTSFFFAALLLTAIDAAHAASDEVTDPCADTSRYEIDWSKVVLSGKCPNYSFIDPEYGTVSIKYSACINKYAGLTKNYSSDTNLGLPYNSSGGYGEAVTLSWSNRLRNMSFCLIDADYDEVYRIEAGSAEIIPVNIDSRSKWSASSNTLSASHPAISNKLHSSENQSCFIVSDIAGVTSIKITTVKSSATSGGSAYSFGSNLKTACDKVPDANVSVTKELVVKGTDTWLDTGLDLKSGDQITITATDKWRNDRKAETIWVTGDGFGTYKHPDATLPDANFASLIGRFGDTGTPFFVGSNFGPSSPGEGRFFLQMNDIPGLFPDNEGELKVTIEIK